jgi:hypothetical protein
MSLMGPNDQANDITENLNQSDKLCYSRETKLLLY